MHTHLLAAHIGISEDDVQALLSLGQARIYQTDFYKSLVDSLDYDLLSGTLQEVRAAYDRHLPAVADQLRRDYHLSGKGMSSLTLGNWILGFLNTPDHLNKLSGFHRSVPRDVLTAGLPDILDIIDTMGAGSSEWKRAMAIMSLPLFADP